MREAVLTASPQRSGEEVISLVDREQGGAELYQKEGLKFRAVFTITQIQVRYQELG